MSRFSTSVDVDVIDHFVRKAHIERSLAFSAAGRLAVDSVKKSFLTTVLTRWLEAAAEALKGSTGRVIPP